MIRLNNGRITIRVRDITIYFAIVAVIAYVTGGVAFAFDQSLIHNKIFVILVILFSLESTVLGSYIFIRNTDPVKRSEETATEDNKTWKAFRARYNLCRIDLIVTGILMAAGGAARIIGFDWGKVASWQPDERKLTDAPINMVNYLTPYLDDVYYPNQLISKIVAVLTFIARHFKNVSVDTASSVWVIFLFRVVVAVCGTLTIYVAFLIGNHFRKHLGCFFALLVTIYPYYINLAKQVTGDVTAMLFLSLLMLYSLRYMDEKKDRYLAMMCACAAMATLEKWHGAVGIGYIGVLLLFCVFGFGDYIVKGLKALGLYILSLFILAPNIVVKPVQTIRDGFINIAVYNDYEHPPYFVELFGYFQHGYRYVFGLAGLILFVLGFYYIVITFNRKYLVFLVGIVKIMCLSFLNRSFARWGFEFYFGVLFIISFGIYYSVFGCKWKSKMIRGVLTSIVSVCAVIMISSMISASYLAVIVAASGSQDTRLLQRSDCRKLGISPDDMVSQYYSGFEPASRCDSEYPDHDIVRKKDWNEYFVYEGDNVYRTGKQTDYLCLCPSYNAENHELSKVLDETENAKRILEYDSICPDTFFIPFCHDNDTLNDLELIKSNVEIAGRIRNGGLTGLDIVVYDVSQIPVI